jgi:osmotically-inducible protein OsmY
MVTLRGTVPSQSIHQTILQTVRGVSGVKSIDDRITVGH